MSKYTSSKNKTNHNIYKTTHFRTNSYDSKEQVQIDQPVISTHPSPCVVLAVIKRP